MYGELKKFITNELKVISQFVMTNKLKSKNYLSVVTKIKYQMNVKAGGALWQVIPKHKYWKNKDTVCAGISFSKGPKGWTMAFNGTFSNDFTKTWSECKIGIKNKENIDYKQY